MGEANRYVSVVTGAGSGIGSATAAMLAARGDAVVVNDIRADVADETARRIRAAGGTAIACSGDVSEPEFAPRLMATTVSTFGHVDALVNSAGILTRATLQELDPADWDRVLSVNLRSVFLCSQAAARAMITRGGGAIVSIASVRGFAGSAVAPHYAAAKAGVIAFTRSFAGEIAPQGIRVNAVAPGLTDTDQPRSILTDAELEIAAGEIPLGRMARPSDIAAAVIFLCSPAASHITGTTLLVSGGSYVG